MVGASDRPATADLGEGAARLGHSGCKVSELVVTSLIRVADIVVSIDVLGPEDSCVDLGQIVWACAGDDCSFCEVHRVSSCLKGKELEAEGYFAN